MKKLLVLVAATLTLACSHNGDSSSAPGGRTPTGNPDIDASEQKLDQVFSKYNGHGPSTAELTANSWCDNRNGEKVSFHTNGTFEANDPGHQTMNGTYTLNGTTLNVSALGKNVTAFIEIASDAQVTMLRIQFTAKPSAVYQNCAF